MQEIFMISKANWMIVDLEMVQYEHSSFPVYYNWVNTHTHTRSEANCIIKSGRLTGDLTPDSLTPSQQSPTPSTEMHTQFLSLCYTLYHILLCPINNEANTNGTADSNIHICDIT